MVERTVRIGSAHGLHARPAKIFTAAAADSGLDVTLSTADGRSVDAASILGVMSLGINLDDQITLTTDGDTAEAVLDHLAALLTTDQDAEAGAA